MKINKGLLGLLFVITSIATTGIALQATVKDNIEACQKCLKDNNCAAKIGLAAQDACEAECYKLDPSGICKKGAMKTYQLQECVRTQTCA